MKTVDISPAELISTLQELQTLELEARSKKRKSPKASARIKELRTLVPETILGHHDRLVAKNKKSVVAVVNGVCGGCFLALPTGEKARIALQQDIHLCQNCGRYLTVDD